MTIVLWHGKDEKLVKKLEDIGCYTSQENRDGNNECTITWPATLQEFVTRWDDKFLAMKKNGEWIVAVTQHGSFGQR